MKNLLQMNPKGWEILIFKLTVLKHDIGKFESIEPNSLDSVLKRINLMQEILEKIEDISGDIK